MSNVTVSGGELTFIVDKAVESIKKQMVSRGYRAANELRNAALEVLDGQRSGRVYKKPKTYGKKPSKATRQLRGDYGHKLRGGQLYRASAPGEPPARRMGNLRLHWVEHVKPEGDSVTAEIENTEKYAGYMEHGTPGGKIAPRPYVDRIREKARPRIVEIYGEPYA